MIHSVNAVTELLKANTELRDHMESVERELESKEAENSQLNIENQQLRERVELVEGILKGNSSHIENSLSSSVRSKIDQSNSQYGHFNRFKEEKFEDSGVISVDSVYNELIHLRKMNRALEDRIKQLEVQNLRMTNQGFSSVKSKHMEPNRPIFQGQPELDSGAAVAQESSDDNYTQGHPLFDGYADKRTKLNETVYSNQKPLPVMVNRSGVGVSQNMLPRPHHTIEKFKVS